jgi:hypothetical protein
LLACAATDSRNARMIIILAINMDRGHILLC